MVKTIGKNTSRGLVVQGDKRLAPVVPKVKDGEMEKVKSLDCIMWGSRGAKLVKCGNGEQGRKG